jgi:hypothetical protein
MDKGEPGEIIACAVHLAQRRASIPAMAKVRENDELRLGFLFANRLLGMAVFLPFFSLVFQFGLRATGW